LQEFRHMIRMGQTGVAKKIFKIKPEVEWFVRTESERWRQKANNKE
jgi:hypothetical protein